MPSQETMAKTDRVVISVSGGVAEEVTELSHGPAVVYIVDFDDLDASTEQDRQDYIKQFPEDIQEWIQEGV